ncbi:MAG: Rare lipoprotein A family protein [uncultured bacterium]|nr:MAG: Rare lipoprotein A family protein [uncultured bacterium]
MIMIKRTIKLLPFLLFALAVAGCDSGGDKNPASPSSSYYQTGIASWYGAEYHGQPTSSGELFDKNAMTAAHRELAFNTWVQVYNLENGRKIRVRINDRGPTKEERIIDLSERAADELGMKIAGLAQVGIEIVSGP